jgi:hypothetical protein
MITEQTEQALPVSNRPNIYNLLNQRLVQHGKPFFILVAEAADTMKADPGSMAELTAFAVSFFGRWSPDPSRRVQPQSILAVEHMRLMDDISASEGEDFAVELEERALLQVCELVVRRKKMDIMVWRGSVTPIAEVASSNAWAVPIHGEIEAWVASNKETFLRKTTPASDVGYLQLSQQFAGTGATLPGQQTRFQKVFAEFMAAITSARGQGRAVVIQSSLCTTFARSIRKHVKDMGLEAQLQADPGANKLSGTG